MTSFPRSVWDRMRSSVAAEVAARGTDNEAELLRQMTDVFKELAHLSVDLGAVWSSLEETKGKLDEMGRRLDVQATVFAEFTDTVNEQIENDSESTELLGRLLQSARARIEVLEGGRQSPA
ncbi:MAG: hypothetical protein WAL04_11770 [Acidimicrobiales bacterium]